MPQLGVLHGDQPHLARQAGGRGDHHGRRALAPAVDPAPELDALRHVLRDLQFEQRPGRRTPARHVGAGVQAQAGRPRAGQNQRLILIGVEAKNQIAAILRRARLDHHPPLAGGARLEPQPELPSRQFAAPVAVLFEGLPHPIQRRQFQIGEPGDLLADVGVQGPQLGRVDRLLGGAAVAVAAGEGHHPVQHPLQRIAEVEGGIGVGRSVRRYGFRRGILQRQARGRRLGIGRGGPFGRVVVAGRIAPVVEPVGDHLAQQGFQGVLEHEHRLAAGLEFAQPELHGVIDLERQQEQPVELVQPRPEVHRLQARPRAPAFVAVAQRLGQPLVLLVDHGLDVAAEVGHLFQNAGQPVGEVAIAGFAAAVRRGAKRDLAEIVLAADQNAVLGQHLGEHFLQRRAARLQQLGQAVAAVGRGQHRRVQLQVVGALGVGGAGKHHARGGRDQGAHVLERVRTAGGVVRLVGDDQWALPLGDGQQPAGLGALGPRPVDLRIGGQHQVAVRRQRAGVDPAPEFARQGGPQQGVAALGVLDRHALVQDHRTGLGRASGVRQVAVEIGKQVGLFGEKEHQPPFPPGPLRQSGQHPALADAGFIGLDEPPALMQRVQG